MSEVAPIILLNSLGTTSSLWDDVVGHLDGHPTIRFDQRGHGSDAHRPGPFRMGDLARDVEEQLDRHGARRAHVVGISLGGMIGILAAAAMPHRVASLTVMCAAPYLEPEPWADRAALVRAHGMGAVVDSVLARWFTPQFTAEHPSIVDRHRRMLTAAHPAGYAFACEMLAGADVRPALSAVSAPTLVLSGTEDSATPPADQRAIAAGIAGARLVELQGVAHMAPPAAPARVAAEVLRMVRGRQAESVVRSAGTRLLPAIDADGPEHEQIALTRHDFARGGAAVERTIASAHSARPERGATTST